MCRLFPALLAILLFAQAAASQPEKSEKKSKFTVSKETTYVEGPLDKDGYIDYVAAVNERLKKGVTPDNNANVLLWQAMGPRPTGTTMPPGYFKWMDIEPPPEMGDYFIDISEYLKKEGKLDPAEQMAVSGKQLTSALQRGWKADEYPHLAAWLKANEKPLNLVVQATKRSRYYSPLVPTKKDGELSGLIGALLPGVQKCRSLVSALTARSLLLAGQANSDDAWRDLLSCHRLARLVSQGGTLIEELVGMSIETNTCRADLAFLEHDKPNGQEIENCLSDLQKLSPLPGVADHVDFFERLMLLDIMLMTDRQGIRFLETMRGGQPEKEDPFTKLMLKQMDWDPALRTANRWHDRLAAALREKDRGIRMKKLNEAMIELRATKVRVANAKDELVRLMEEGDDRPTATGKVMGDILIALLLPAVDRVSDGADRAQQVHDNVILAFAVAWYHRDNNSYPKELSALAPKYLKEIPLDLFSGKPLIYRPTADGYLLYSVGVNGKDDGGRGPLDTPRGDDLSIRVPLPELPK